MWDVPETDIWKHYQCFKEEADRVLSIRQNGVLLAYSLFYNSIYSGFEDSLV